MRRSLATLTSLLLVVFLAAPAVAAPIWAPSLPVGSGRTYITYFSDGTAYVLHTNGTVHQLFRSTDGGITWTPLVAPEFAGTGRLDMATPRIGYGVAGNVLKTTDGAATWSELPTPRVPAGSPYFRALDSADGRRVVLGGEFGEGGCALPQAALFTTGDGGKTWRTVPLGFEGIVREVEMLDARNGVAVALEVEAASTPMCGWESTTSSVFATRDGGRSWQRILDCPQYCMSVGMATRDRIVVGVGSGAVMVTSDGGKTWTDNGALANYLISYYGTPMLGFNDIEFADASVGYASTRGGDTWRTDDGGLTWTRELTTEMLYGSGEGDLAVADADHALAGGPNVVIRRVP